MYANASIGRFFWKNGILFVKHDTRVLIHGNLPATTDEGIITISISTTSETSQKDLQVEILRRIFQSLHTQGRNPSLRDGIVKFDYLDAFNERLMVAVKDDDFVPLKEVKRYANDGLTALVWNNKRHSTASFDPFLSVIDVPKPTPSVFISYSHEDRDELEELVTHLSLLKREGVKVFDDGEIEVGEKWSNVIKDNLKAADIVVLLVSANFVNSDFIFEKELRPTLDRIERANTEGNSDVRIIPVLLKRCIIPNSLSKFQFLPMNEQQRREPVNQWLHKDEAWTQIAQAITDALR
jgi:hypothetical protein